VHTLTLLMADMSAVGGVDALGGVDTLRVLSIMHLGSI